jgi:cytochrome c biogenesis protein CcmG, thiol:disulfide interchange protein DsbE
MQITSLRWRFFSTVALLLGAAWIWISADASWDTTAGKIPAPRRGFLAPDFSLLNLQGETITLSELRGRPVLINLWATWCPPCRAEMPDMQTIFEAYHEQGFLILAINATYQDSAAATASFVEEYGLTFPILMDTSGEVSRQYQMRALPTSFFVDREGIIQEVVVGGPMSPALLQVRVEQLLKGDD